MTICEICNNTVDNKSYVAREMMYGYRDKFEYFECGKCGCLQINDVPENLSKYYPTDYYSIMKIEEKGLLKSFLKRQLANYSFYNKGIIGKMLTMKYDLAFDPEWFRRSKVSFDSKILDVGCGSGHLLYYLQLVGFSNCTGIDPFISEDIFYNNGVTILKKEIRDHDDQFDFIMLHHSFEHMKEPLSVLKELFRLLKPDRYIVIRIPIASFAWSKYGVNWIQLDAPRHLFLHTTKSVQILTEQVGFRIADMVFESTDFQFWGSEQYVMDIPLKDSLSYAVNPRKSIFSKKQINYFKAKAHELNDNGEGDTVCIYLYKP
jgi:SAM-dependent methyltransferase